MNKIIAPCFTTVPCPQRGQKVRVCREMLAGWCESIRACGLRGIVCYDELEWHLRTEWQDCIDFHKVPRPPEGMSINDWRFFVYRDLLKTWPQIESAFFTDLFDCVVQHDPFPWLAEKNCLVVGMEARLDQSQWMMDMLIQAFGDAWRKVLLGDFPLCTPGCFGGTAKLLLPFLDMLCGLLTMIHVDDPTLNANLPAFQIAVHAGLCGRKVHFGPPLHHPDWRQGERDPAAFFHHHWMPTGQESPLFTEE